MKNKIVEKIVKVIWDDLCDRRGYDLGCLDNEIKKEIKKAWTEKISSVLRGIKNG